MSILISLEEESDFDDIYESLVDDQVINNKTTSMMRKLIKVKYQMKKPKISMLLRKLPKLNRKIETRVTVFSLNGKC